MTSKDVRKAFLEFFEARGHKIVPSAPIVVKDDPTLLFTNAGMNQFKDYFLGTKKPEVRRIADTQKCLRVSGKHNDLEEVGVDTYHHTMFEMLGNWSFGDYFKQEAIDWAWELLTGVYGLDPDRLYVSVFGGDTADGLEADTEAEKIWQKHVAADRILHFGKKDNFWEMGDTGPCGPCSEIHVDLRSDEERRQTDGRTLVNNDHEQVIEIWNLVFIQFNRQADGKLTPLPEKHVDTGMGLERVVRAVNGKHSNYDVDLFTDTISTVSKLAGMKYGEAKETDIAFRVIADHIRALSFCISDGQLPSNTGAGYVLRRILRRAVRYGYSFLGFREPFLCELVKPLSAQFGSVFPELTGQVDFVSNVIRQEEISFFRTLTSGLDRLSKYFEVNPDRNIPGTVAFELYDTYGFPVDLTQLLAAERGLSVDMAGFDLELSKQKSRSRADSVRETGDWILVRPDDRQEFVGYDLKEAIVQISRYRTIIQKGKEVYQLVFNLTPFYAESGGQIGDTGILKGLSDGTEIRIIDTQKENDLIVHIADKLPADTDQEFRAVIDRHKQELTARNHSATHLLHAALKQVLGDHVAQKGSLVEPDRLRFDFSHFSKMTDEEIARVEQLVNGKIREAVALQERRNVPYQEAIDSGVTALFGEKYGDTVRVITFDPDYSNELCGGIHVPNTAVIGQFRIVSESSISAGVRRIEAITSVAADKWIDGQLEELSTLKATLGNPVDALNAVRSLQEENSTLRKELAQYEKQKLDALYGSLEAKIRNYGDLHVLLEKLESSSAADAKDLCFRLGQNRSAFFCMIAADTGGSPSLSVYISKDLCENRNWNAGQLVREWAKAIQGGGGGQPFFAQAGGKKVEGLDEAVELCRNWLGQSV